ncbi:hypothetical protein P7C71_g4243, partial [Lecanoromycetidae sp. Uapishka_2]
MRVINSVLALLLSASITVFAIPSPVKRSIECAPGYKCDVGPPCTIHDCGLKLCVAAAACKDSTKGFLSSSTLAKRQSPVNGPYGVDLCHGDYCNFWACETAPSCNRHKRDAASPVVDYFEQETDLGGVHPPCTTHDCGLDLCVNSAVCKDHVKQDAPASPLIERQTSVNGPHETRKEDDHPCPEICNEKGECECAAELPTQ